MKAEARSLPPARLEPLRALRALRELIKNPDDTSQVFTIIEAFSGGATARMLERFRSTESGRRILESRTSILTTIRDRAYLESLPDGSLGRAYLAFLDREGISADGLVEASIAGEQGYASEVQEVEAMKNRMRDTHDLWHAVTGYHGDVFGEASLLAFSVAQTRNPGIALIVFGAIVRAHDLELTKMIVRGYREGKRCAFLPSLEWEELLPLPLEEVRARLSIEPVPAYEPVRSGWLRETGELRPAA